MLLHTPLYLLFLLLVAGVYWALPRPAWRRGWLLAASYGFYAAFDYRFALLLLGLSLAVYALGRAMPGSRHARTLAWLSVGLNLGVLAFFKYAGFFLAPAALRLQALGLPGLGPGLALLLPLGLSFYTFQAIAYTTEIYRQRLAPARSFVELGLYLAFFPKLIAGPLVRPQVMLEQLAAAGPRPTVDRLGEAAGLLLLGLFKKRLVADSLAVLADSAFQAAGWPAGTTFTRALYWQGFYLYAFEIYMDFAGYTDLARGSALLLGIELPHNFRQPYLAPTLTEFWNRWHMSLTSWFREYVYFPLTRGLLGLTRRRYTGLVQASANLVTMAVIGLWHGSTLAFLVWGLWHGLGLTVERWFQYRPAGRWRRVLAGLLTFHLVAVGWVFFRAGSLSDAARFLGGLLAFQQMHWLAVLAPPVLLTAALVLALDLAGAGLAGATWSGWHRFRPALVIAAIVVLAALGLLDLARGTDSRPFIYGQF
jgi:D-alanyl-lipoteichoic acid acyltransferase DltB (MBOAT superfamily)